MDGCLRQAVAGKPPKSTASSKKNSSDRSEDRLLILHGWPNTCRHFESSAWVNGPPSPTVPSHRAKEAREHRFLPTDGRVASCSLPLQSRELAPPISFFKVDRGTRLAWLCATEAASALRSACGQCFHRTSLHHLVPVVRDIAGWVVDCHWN